MKRKLWLLAVLVLCLVLAVGILAACNGSGGSGQQTPCGEDPGTNIPGGEEPGTSEEVGTAGLVFELSNDQSSYAVLDYIGNSRGFCLL